MEPIITFSDRSVHCCTRPSWPRPRLPVAGQHREGQSGISGFPHALERCRPRHSRHSSKPKLSTPSYSERRMTGFAARRILPRTRTGLDVPIYHHHCVGPRLRRRLQQVAADRGHAMSVQPLGGRTSAASQPHQTPPRSMYSASLLASFHSKLL
jgi:hypothetical protein